MVVIIIIIIIICYTYGMYNLLNYLKDKIDKCFIELDNIFQKRINLIPTLINIFKQYNLEKDTIKKIISLTEKDYSTLNKKEKIDINIELNKLIDRLWQIADSNLILKQNPVFLNVIKQFNLVEEKINLRKKDYNTITKKYNKIIKIFPNMILSKILKFYPEPIYSVDEKTRKVIKIDYRKND